MTTASASTATSSLIASIAHQVSSSQVQEFVKHHLDTEFNDLDILLGISTSNGRAHAAGPSRKKRRTLDQEIIYWESQESAASAELARTSVELPSLLETTQGEIQKLLSSAQDLSLRRYGLVDRLSRLIGELDSDQSQEEGEGKGGTLLDQLEGLQTELERLEVSLDWVSAVERVVQLSEHILDPRYHTPSPLATVPKYRDLQTTVGSMKEALPPGMSLLAIVEGVRDKTWLGLKDIMSENLLKACETLKWPMKVDYASHSPSARRAFERAYQDLLYLQAEGERLHPTAAGKIGPTSPDWTSGNGLYPLQAMVGPVSLRFKYHFQGSRNTNRVDKPEWAFANILDQLYEHQAFISDYLQPLTIKAGFDVSVKSEFILLLFPTLLGFLRQRIPHLLPHPALLAHTIYQTILFDESIKSGGFDLAETSVASPGRGAEDGGNEWEGLAGITLKHEGWFDQWVAGERKFGESQVNDIISSAQAWDISEDLTEEEMSSSGLKPTVSARQIKALIEQITDRYSPLPLIEHKLPFLTSIQLPLLTSYASRISGSMDAFETISSAFVRSVPGALASNIRGGGVQFDQSKLTGGVEGLGRLVKGLLSAQWVLAAMRGWADDPFFVELSDELESTPSIRWRIQSEPLLQNPLPSANASSGSGVTGAMSVWDLLIERYEALCARGEAMIVRLITAEVEQDLKKHLQRRWDQQVELDSRSNLETYPSLVSALTTLSSDLSFIKSTLPPSIIIRIYNHLICNLTTHISQRGIYSGWSKFTAVGGKSFQGEIKEFIHTSKEGLGGLIPEMVVEGPWRSLVDMGKVLAVRNDSDVEELETEGEEGEVLLSDAMAAAWSGGGADGGSLMEFNRKLGVEYEARELQALLRRRVDCWR